MDFRGLPTEEIKLLELVLTPEVKDFREGKISLPFLKSSVLEANENIYLDITQNLNDWSINPSNNFKIKKLFVWCVQINKKRDQMKIYLTWLWNS